MCKIEFNGSVQKSIYSTEIQKVLIWMNFPEFAGFCFALVELFEF